MIVGKDGIPMLTRSLMRADQLIMYVGRMGLQHRYLVLLLFRHHIELSEIVGLRRWKNLQHPQAVEESLPLCLSQGTNVLANLNLMFFLHLQTNLIKDL